MRPFELPNMNEPHRSSGHVAAGTSLPRGCLSSHGKTSPAAARERITNAATEREFEADPRAAAQRRAADAEHGHNDANECAAATETEAMAGRQWCGEAETGREAVRVEKSFPPLGSSPIADQSRDDLPKGGALGKGTAAQSFGISPMHAPLQYTLPSRLHTGMVIRVLLPGGCTGSCPPEGCVDASSPNACMRVGVDVRVQEGWQPGQKLLIPAHVQEKALLMRRGNDAREWATKADAERALKADSRVAPEWRAEEGENCKSCKGLQKLVRALRERAETAEAEWAAEKVARRMAERRMAEAERREQAGSSTMRAALKLTLPMDLQAGMLVDAPLPEGYDEYCQGIQVQVQEGWRPGQTVLIPAHVQEHALQRLLRAREHEAREWAREAEAKRVVEAVARASAESRAVEAEEKAERLAAGERAVKAESGRAVMAEAGLWRERAEAAVAERGTESMARVLAEKRAAEAEKALHVAQERAMSAEAEKDHRYIIIS